jgi:hypothetical protein
MMKRQETESTNAMNVMLLLLVESTNGDNSTDEDSETIADCESDPRQNQNFTIPQFELRFAVHLSIPLPTCKDSADRCNFVVF